MILENRKLLVLSKFIINIFWIFQLLFILTLVVYTLFLFFNVDFLDINLLKGFKIHFSKIDFLQPLIYQGNEYNIKLTNGEGRLHIDDFEQNFIYFRIFAAFVDSIMYLLILYFLKNIFKNLTTNQFFIHENGILIKKIGFSIIALAIIPDIIHYFTDIMISKTIQIENVVIKNEFHIDIQTILLGILIFVISIVFLRGIELRKDQELTI